MIIKKMSRITIETFFFELELINGRIGNGIF